MSSFVFKSLSKWPFRYRKFLAALATGLDASSTTCAPDVRTLNRASAVAELRLRVPRRDRPGRCEGGGTEFPPPWEGRRDGVKCALSALRAPDSPNPTAHFTGASQGKGFGELFTSTRKKVLGATASLALAAGVGALAAAPADASTVWDRVAACESGGNWRINTGNGFSGGLQFTPSTWRANGGTGSASSASKAQQIAVAQRVLATQGPGAWPVCGPRAGLGRANGGASSSATVTSTHTTRYAAKRYASRAYVAKHYVAKHYTAKNYVAKRAANGSSVNSVSYFGRGSETVKVTSGDTLSKLAERFHVAGGWQALWNLNRSQIKDPNLIFVGQVLNVQK